MPSNWRRSRTRSTSSNLKQFQNHVRLRIVSFLSLFAAMLQRTRKTRRWFDETLQYSPRLLAWPNSLNTYLARIHGSVQRVELYHRCDTEMIIMMITHASAPTNPTRVDLLACCIIIIIIAIHLSSIFIVCSFHNRYINDADGDYDDTDDAVWSETRLAPHPRQSVYGTTLIKTVITPARISSCLTSWLYG